MDAAFSRAAAASAPSPGQAEETGCVFDLQRFSVHDGPGIRSLLFLKGCPLRCSWCANPESQRFERELLLDPEKCVACGRCVAACRSGAVSRVGEALGFDRDRCLACGDCADVCAAGARVRAGRIVTAEAVLAELLRDEPFFRNSGGGVTLGGGEPLAQPAFARAVLRRCRERGLHTAVETCGQVAWASVEAVLPWTSLFLFDLKHIDAARHRRETGGDLERILTTLDRLAGLAQVVLRIPIIPGFNDQPETAAAIAARGLRAGIRSVHLLPYHGFGQAKYCRLGRAYPFTGEGRVPADRLEAIRTAVAATGLTVAVGG
jgi:pyruvate formate lyase activating enzyme